jgi:hypothetical protein
VISLDPPVDRLTQRRLHSNDRELAQEASAYFRKQSHLIEVQTEHLHEQRAVNLSLLKLKRFDERLKVGLRARWRTVPSESTMRLPRIWISWRCWRRAASKVPASLCRSFRR